MKKDQLDEVLDVWALNMQLSIGYMILALVIEGITEETKG